MLKLLDLRNASGNYLDSLPRPKVIQELPVDAVREIITRVKNEGDKALLAYTADFDRVKLSSLQVPYPELEAAYKRISSDLRDALLVAADAIRGYHQLEVETDKTFSHNGLTVTQRSIPVSVAGCYVPGGKARYPSSVLMTAIPAKVAGVDQIVLCVPPGPDGKVDDATLAAAYIAEVDKLYSVGGAQAIAAMAYGTETVARADVIVGPGNIYVSVAKREVAQDVGIPTSFAGPSEVVVIADSTTPAPFAAIDVVVQAEHGPDGLAWFVSWDQSVIEEVVKEVDKIVVDSPRRAEIESTLSEGGFAVLVRDPAQAIEVSNAIAPEHLEILCDSADELIGNVRNAGAVFIGKLSPASLGDYVAGPSHVLPTYGSARFSSALRVSDFVKHIHVVEASQAGIDNLAPHVSAIAASEGLYAHQMSVNIRSSDA
ncbi:MAG: histidinol dehydrogenase [Actinobacteria bacterium]|jgi:histidinol dehydrogenase|nr:histidinol dehydrogenase [Actinomycetota bacterium]